MSWFDNTLSWWQRFGINVVTCGQVPKHVAFIMDGNRRYAEKKNIQRNDGHVKGDMFKEKGVRVRIIGKLSLLPADIRKLAAETMLVTRDNTKLTLNIAHSYTGREEITQAVSAVVSGVSQGKIDQEDVSEQLISDCLYTSPGLYPDLVIRTSGELRLSDFLVWQISASCLYFTDKLWPEFGVWDMLLAILYYQRIYDDLTDVRRKEQRSDDASDTRLNEFIEDVRKARDLSFV